MSSIYFILKNIKNLLPYFLLIAIYFLFVNLEAKKDKDNVINTNIDHTYPEAKSSTDDKNFRIKIPVIPYND